MDVAFVLDHNISNLVLMTSAIDLQSPKAYIMQLTSILQNDKITMDYVAESIQTRGYVFVRLPTDLVQKIDECVLLIEQFFSNSLYYKKSFYKKPIFGYFSVQHKESFRLLTGSRLNEQTMPHNFDKIKDLIQTNDQIAYIISTFLSPNLFPDLFEKAKKLNIPFFDMQKRWGMFDFARYHNDGFRKGLNCQEHFDPGLLSFHIRSTEVGLQLKDEFGKWIHVPTDKTLAVLWAGKAATQINPKIKPCIHRVDCALGKSRISLWHEICTESQEHKELLKDTKQLIAKSYELKTGIPMTKSGF